MAGAVAIAASPVGTQQFELGVPLTMGVRLIAVVSVIAMVRNCNKRALESDTEGLFPQNLTDLQHTVYVDNTAEKNGRNINKRPLIHHDIS